MKYPKIKLGEISDCWKRQWFIRGSQRWSVAKLIALAEDMPVFDVPLAFLDISGQFTVNNLLEFATHVKQCNDADLDYPILLDDEGSIMDGRHRVIKAFIEGRDTIRCVRFLDMPVCDGED
jgi:hypothetical protein